MDRAERNAEISSLSDMFNRSQIALCANYQGLSVAKITSLRREIRGVGGTSKVVKNTLAKISFERMCGEDGKSSAEAQKFLNLLDGPNLVIFSLKDAVAPARVVKKFEKDNQVFQVKGAWFEGAFVDAAGVEALSKLPSREELLSQLLRIISAPATQMVRLLNAPGTQLVRVIDAYRAKLEGAKAA